MAYINYESPELKALSARTQRQPAISTDRFLAALFKEEIGDSFGSYLTRRRIDTARALLTRTEYTYSQIAYSLAFCSQSHFIKVFREKTGFTPRQYRMQFSDSNFAADLRSSR